MPKATSELTTRGYTVIPDVLDAAEVGHLIDVLGTLIEEDLAHPDPRRRNDDWMSFNGVLRDPAIAGGGHASEPPLAGRGDSRADVHHVRLRQLQHATERSELFHARTRRLPACDPFVPDEHRGAHRAHRLHDGERCHPVLARVVRTARSTDPRGVRRQRRYRVAPVGKRGDLQRATRGIRGE